MNENKKYFYGNEISEYGIKHNRVDYATLSKAFNAVLCNDITKLFYSDINGEYNEIEQVNGFIDNQDEQPEIYQYYIISDSGYNILKYHTNEIVYYIPVLDIYVWGVTHWGTSWDYVLTDIKIEEE